MENMVPRYAAASRCRLCPLGRSYVDVRVVSTDCFLIDEVAGICIILWFLVVDALIAVSTVS